MAELYRVKVLAELVAVALFIQVINFFIEQTFAFLKDTNPVSLRIFIQQPTLGCKVKRIRKHSNLSELAQINFEKLAQILTLNFYSNELGTFPRNMNLSKGRGRQGRSIKFIEQLANWFT
jgi:hypothetical protein